MHELISDTVLVHSRSYDDDDDDDEHLQPTARGEEAEKQKRNLMQTLTIHNECSILFGRIRLGLFGLGHLNGANPTEPKKNYNKIKKL